MLNQPLPRICHVEAGDKSFMVLIRWTSGEIDEIDLAGIMKTYKVFAPLCRDSSAFRSVKVGEHGTDIVWSEGVDMSNDTLWRLAREQSGVVLPAEVVQQ